MGQLTASYDAGTAGAPLVGDTIGVALAKMVVAQPDVEALVSRHQGVRLSYSELGAQVEQVALGLLAVGIETGDRVGIWSPTCVEWTLLQFACARVGAILVNVNPAYRPNELAYALRHSGVRLLVTARPFKTSDYLAMLAGVRGELPALELVVTIGGESAGGAEDLDWPDAASSSATASPPIRSREREPQLDSDDPINIQYTSGTTGNPKGATLTHHNILNNAPGDRRGARLHARPTACASPCRCTTASAWASATWAASRRARRWCTPPQAFDPLATLEAHRRGAVHAVYGVPTMFIAMLEHPRFAEFDTHDAADRDHGGRAMPRRGHEARRRRDARARDLHRVRHDRDRAGVVHHPRATTTSTAASAPSAPCCRNVEAKIVDPGDGRDGAHRHSRARCARVATS